MAGPSGSTAAPAPQDARALTRRILALAVPAFGALIAEPLFLLADTAIIGHLGTAQLAGVGIGTTILHTLTGLMIFLAYATTPAVARLIGAGNLAAAMDRGRDGIWLGLLLGTVLAVLGWLAAPALTAALGATGEVQAHAVAYLRWSMPGLPALLAVLAATGVLRGLQDTVTPLVVAGVGFGANIGLNVALVYGLGWGVAGSAVGTSVVQWAMLVTYLFVLAPRFRRSGTVWAPRASGMRATAQVGSWLLLRTASLRAAILITVMAAAGAGDLTLAAHQLVFTLFSTLAFALDALAIAAQALIGAELGAARPDAARRLTRTMVRWGLGFGVVTGAVLALAAPVLPGLFTTDPTVQAAATVGLWVLAAGGRVRVRAGRRADRRRRRPLPRPRRPREPRGLRAGALGARAARHGRVRLDRGLAPAERRRARRRCAAGPALARLRRGLHGDAGAHPRLAGPARRLDAARRRVSASGR